MSLGQSLSPRKEDTGNRLLKILPRELYEVILALGRNQEDKDKLYNTSVMQGVLGAF